MKEHLVEIVLTLLSIFLAWLSQKARAWAAAEKKRADEADEDAEILAETVAKRAPDDVTLVNDLGEAAKKLGSDGERVTKRLLKKVKA